MGKLTDLANFRQLGGLENREGKKIQENRLLRSGELYNLNQASRDLLNEHQLIKVIDLRGADEREKRPDDQLPEINYAWIDIMKDVENTASMSSFMEVGDVEGIDQHMFSIYDNLILDKGAQEGYRQYFEELLKTENGSVLFHCFAGKDRTGIAAALTLELLDVPKTTIYQDYLATNAQRQVPNQLMFDELIAQGANERQVETMRVAMEVKTEYLEHAYQLLEKTFGDITNYSKEVLHLAASDLKDLKALYLK
ncbi:protein-tyrosine phosphatase [Enterococcus sp. PF1-24]|uniref:tyrosine-protein phosphatase n=1 Tax=unclassified Enterococcus TaxID=2608891 RepID=UPI0024751FCA|nr:MULTISPECIES: tyrosine-protein phosphatase [unclassified Enterococcus]MDH6363556.1 protein-tyrosine phosphatase [Enterococcus sp. PFB1-1]MDH6400791.1 protein-tyrosine phosphatase [Enterococcus sp. PF1-24]